MIRLNSLKAPLEGLEKIPLEARRDARVVMGHFHHGAHKFIPKECVYVTMLREPIARVLSIQRHVREHPRHSWHNELMEMGFEKFVETWADPGIDNLQTRLLSGRREDLVSMRKPSDLDQKALDDAKRNLEDCLTFGLTERFDESFIMLRRALGWKVPMYVTLNVSSGAKQQRPNERTMELIHERNQFDLELYRFARDLFAAKVDEHGKSLQREVAVFRVANKVPNKVFPHAEGAIRRLMPARFPPRPTA